jgi:hypothetical protein
MKPNPETTKPDRLRAAVGWSLTVLGVLTVTVVGAAYGYHHTMVWVVGMLLIVIGVMIAKGVGLANFLNDTLRF